MIEVIVIRHFLPDKEREAARFLGELRRREVQQDGCQNCDLLWSLDDPSMWIDISSWTYSDKWKEWQSTEEYAELQDKMDDMLLTPEDVITLKIFK